jgi:hypothetical protein
MCEGPSAFYRESQLIEGITGNGLDQKSGASPRNGAEFCAVLAAVQLLFRDTAGTRLGVVREKDLHPTMLELFLYTLP